MKNLFYLLLASGVLFYACSDKSRSNGSSSAPIVAAPVVAPPTVAPPPPPLMPRRAEVLFLGNASLHHNSGKYAPWLAIPMFAKGINMTYTIDTNDLNAENLAKYDGIVIFANYNRISASKEKALRDFVEGGKGLIPLHAASACFTNSAWYIQAVGGSFKSHGTGVFKATTINASHPIMQGINEFASWDESYVHSNINPDMTILQERVEGTTREPWTWVRNQGKGRVFYTAGGHNDSTWTKSDFTKMITNGVMWAIGDRVSQAVTAFRAPTLRYDDTIVVPNYEGRVPAPKFQYALSPEQSMKTIQVPAEFELKLFAAEPDITNPISMSWDERGRLWVIESVDYPNTFVETDGATNDRIKICEDTNGDGKADKFTIFADKLNIPTSLAFANGGVVVTMAPHFVFLKDTNGDDKADVRENIMGGWFKNDTHFGPNNLTYGFNNRLWGMIGTSYAGTTKDGKTLAFTRGMFNLNSDGTDMKFVASQSNNTWGIGFTEDNHIFSSTANGDHSDYYSMENIYMAKTLPAKIVPAGSGVSQGPGAPQGGGQAPRVMGRQASASVLPIQNIQGHSDMHVMTPNLRQVDFMGGFTAAAGHHFYTARNFPKEYWNRIAFVNEPTGRLVHNAIIVPNGAGFKEVDGWNLMSSNDEWVGPVHAQVGPDGAVWVADWYNFIIQHNPTPGPTVSSGKQFVTGQGSAYITPMRDLERGRIYRVVYKNAKPAAPVVLSKDNPASLLAGLENDNMFWRMHAQRLLVESKNFAALSGLYTIVNNQKVDEIGLNSPAVHALWTLHGLGALNGSQPEALQVAIRALSHPAAGVRKAALEVLPSNQQASDAILRLGLMNDQNLNTRMNAFLAIANLVPSVEIGKALYAASLDPKNAADEWLTKSLFAAASTHADGFIAASPKMATPAPGTELTLSQRIYLGVLSQTYTYPIGPIAGARGGTLPITATPDVVGKEIVIKANLAKGSGGVQPVVPSLYRVNTPLPAPNQQVSSTTGPLVPLNGFVFGQGAKDNGYAVFIQDGKLNMVVNQDGKSYVAKSTGTLPAQFDLVAKLAVNGEMSMEVNGKQVAKGKAPSAFTKPLLLDVRAGRDTPEAYLRASRTPTAAEKFGTYPGLFIYTGANTSVSLQVNKPIN